jgi:MerR family regulatory protein
VGAHAVVVWEGYQLNRKRNGSRYGLSHCGSAHAVRMDEDLLAIGAFARLCRLSVKRLRHYDDMGLLVPAWFDP